MYVYCNFKDLCTYKISLWKHQRATRAVQNYKADAGEEGNTKSWTNKHLEQSFFPLRELVILTEEAKKLNRSSDRFQVLINQYWKSQPPREGESCWQTLGFVLGSKCLHSKSKGESTLNQLALVGIKGQLQIISFTDTFKLSGVATDPSCLPE